MSKTIGLRDELYEKLEELATAQNVTVEQIIENLVREIEAAHLSAGLERMRAEGILAPIPLGHGMASVEPRDEVGIQFFQRIGTFAA